MKAFQPPRTLSNEHRLSGGSAFYANNRNSWIPEKSDSLLEEADIHWGEKKEGRKGVWEGGTEGGWKKRKKESRYCLNPKYFIDVLKYLEGVLRCSVTF